MTLLEAIASATTEHTVNFLVSAYIESLQHFHTSLGIPAPVTVLPLQGPGDIQRRLALLSQPAALTPRCIFGIAEARAVFGCALERLATLERGLLAA